MVCSKADKIQTIGRHKVRQGKAKHPWCNSESPRVSCPYSASDRAPNHHASGRERATAPPLQAQAQAQERGLDWTAAVVRHFPAAAAFASPFALAFAPICFPFPETPSSSHNPFCKILLSVFAKQTCLFLVIAVS